LRELNAELPLTVKEGLKIYKEPIPGHVYCMTVDTGHGKGLDYSAFSVFDMTKYPIEQVAIYHNNEISPFMYPHIVFNTATQYNNSYVIVENNDMGAVVATVLNYDLEYENLLNASDAFASVQQKQYELGVRTSAKLKSIGCSSLKEMMENKKLVVCDETTINELTQFVVSGKSYAAEKGSHDDTVATLWLFAWFSRTEFFNELFLGTSVSEELYRKKIEKEMAAIPFFGIIDNGINDF
jgi:hypothetical protein